MPFNRKVLWLLLIVSAPTFAAPTSKFNASLGLSYENNNNIYLASQNQVSENILHTLFSTSYEKKAAAFNANFSLNADHLNYQNHTFSDQTVYSSLFNLDATISKQRIFWLMDNKFDKIQVNQTLPNTPTNRENANYFKSGPKVVLFKNNKHSLSATFQYQNFYTQTTNGDYDGYIANLEYFRNITRTSSIGLTIDHNKKIFNDSSLNANYDRTDYILTLTRRQKLYTFLIDAGVSHFNFESINSNKTSNYRINYQYKLGEKTDFVFNYRKGFNDYSYLFSAGAPGDISYVNVNSSIFLLKETRLTLLHNFGLVQVNLNYLHSSNDYSDNALDTTLNTMQIGLSYNINSSALLNLSGKYGDARYLGINRKDITKTYLANVRYSLSNSYALTFNVQYSDNASTNSNSNYSERLVIVGGSYYFR